MKRLSTVASVSIFVLLFSAQAHAIKIGIGMEHGAFPKLWEIDSTGALSNPKPVAYPNNGVPWICIAKFLGSSTSMFALQDNGGLFPGHIYSMAIFSSSVQASHMSFHNQTLDEGDCALDPLPANGPNELYGVDAAGGLYKHFNLPPFNNPPVFVGNISAGNQDYSGLAFNAAGDLYALALSGGGHLYKINKTNGVVIDSGVLSGMPVGFSVANGNAGLSFGGTTLRAIVPFDIDPSPTVNVVQYLVNINYTTGVTFGAMTVLGSTGHPGVGSTAIAGLVAYPPAPVPMVPPFALIVLALGIATIGILALRRRPSMRMTR